MSAPIERPLRLAREHERVPLRVANQRRYLRLQGFDYARPGTYFVTIRVRGSVPLFGEVVDGRMCLSYAGRVARQCWCEIPQHFRTVTLDAFVVMPDHMHGVIVIGESRNQRNVGAQHAAPLPQRANVVDHSGLRTRVRLAWSDRTLVQVGDYEANQRSSTYSGRIHLAAQLLRSHRPDRRRTVSRPTVHHDESGSVVKNGQFIGL